SWACLRLERVEEEDELVLLRVAERAVVVDHGSGLAAMPEDGLVAVERGAVVHQPVAVPHSRERRGADLVARALPAVLDDAIAGADVVEEEIAEGVDPLV